METFLQTWLCHASHARRRRFYLGSLDLVAFWRLALASWSRGPGRELALHLDWHDADEQAADADANRFRRFGKPRPDSEVEFSPCCSNCPRRACYNHLCLGINPRTLNATVKYCSLPAHQRQPMRLLGMMRDRVKPSACDA